MTGGTLFFDPYGRNALFIQEFVTKICDDECNRTNCLSRNFVTGGTLFFDPYGRNALFIQEFVTNRK